MTTIFDYLEQDDFGENVLDYYDKQIERIEEVIDCLFTLDEHKLQCDKMMIDIYNILNKGLFVYGISPFNAKLAKDKIRETIHQNQGEWFVLFMKEKYANYIGNYIGNVSRKLALEGSIAAIAEIRCIIIEYCGSLEFTKQ
jgi:hypothetical protein